MRGTKINRRGRVRKASSEEINMEIDKKTLENIKQYSGLSSRAKSMRLKELDKEWDMEKVLEANAASFSLAGLFMGALLHKKWYIFPAVIAAFLLQHALQGWCPPLPFFRRLGIRTRREIDEERTALKTLRGDFDQLSSASDPVEIIRSVRM